MPCPISRYQLPLPGSRSTPASFHSRSSAAWVPERSPREMKGALAAAILRKASETSLLPAIFAGSAFGPITTKSLYITPNRFTPKPSAMNFSSATLSCTNTTSASPRRPMSSACPVPTATTLTPIPLAAVNFGSRKPNSPDCSVDVVEATVMVRSCADAPVDMARTARLEVRTRPANRIRFNMLCLMREQRAGFDRTRLGRTTGRPLAAIDCWSRAASLC